MRAALKSRQRGHGDYGLIMAVPYILGGIGLAVIGGLIWVVWRLCK